MSFKCSYFLDYPNIVNFSGQITVFIPQNVKSLPFHTPLTASYPWGVWSDNCQWYRGMTEVWLSNFQRYWSGHFNLTVKRIRYLAYNANRKRGFSPPAIDSLLTHITQIQTLPVCSTQYQAPTHTAAPTHPAAPTHSAAIKHTDPAASTHPAQQH